MSQHRSTVSTSQQFQLSSGDVELSIDCRHKSTLHMTTRRAVVRWRFDYY